MTLKYRLKDGRILEQTQMGTWDTLDEEGYPVDNNSQAYEMGGDEVIVEGYTEVYLPVDDNGDIVAGQFIP